MSWELAPSEGDWDCLIARVRQARSVLLVGHVNPDGDALGSALAVGLAMRQLGIPAYVSFDESPFRVPSSLAWVPGQHILLPVELTPSDLDVAISLDASAIDRLGRLGAICRSAQLFAALDHHPSYTGFAQLSLVDVTAPATAVLALEMVDRLGAELTKDVATCVYVGLTTDTGSFRYAATTAETHRIAARLHEAGVENDVIARAVFDDRPFAAIKLLGIAIEHAVLDMKAVNGLGLVSTWVSAQDRREFGLPLDAAESIIESIRGTYEAEVAVVLKEGDDGVWRVSTRSKGVLDMSAVCGVFGGGGHRLAAGYSSDKTVEQILADLSAELDARTAPASNQ